MIFQRNSSKQVYSPFVWIRWVIILGVILSSLALSAMYDYRGLYILIAIMIGIVALSIIIVQPPLGIAALLIVSFLVPFEIRTGTQTNLNATVLLLPLLIGIWMMSTDRLPTVIPLTWWKSISTVLPTWKPWDIWTIDS